MAQVKKEFFLAPHQARTVIGVDGTNVKEFQVKYNVSIKIKPMVDNKRRVVVQGSGRSNVKRAKKAILDLVEHVDQLVDQLEVEEVQSSDSEDDSPKERRFTADIKIDLTNEKKEEDEKKKKKEAENKKEEENKMKALQTSTSSESPAEIRLRQAKASFKLQEALAVVAAHEVYDAENNLAIEQKQNNQRK